MVGPTSDAPERVCQFGSILRLKDETNSNERLASCSFICSVACGKYIVRSRHTYMCGYF
jgi:hypothetical protein